MSEKPLLKTSLTNNLSPAAFEHLQLQRKLKNRHIQMLGLGGALGTGLFYGSGEAIAIAGPAILLSYLFGGVFIYFVLRMLGEMTVQEPVSGSFSHFAYRYWGEFAGFLSGWNYWFMFVMVGIAELTVIGIYMDHWVAIDHWKTAFFMLVIITMVNLAAVRFFGEFEFWFSCIKVFAVIGMILFGLLIIISGKGGDHTKFANLWEHGGFFPMGVSGMIMAFTVVMFSFGGSELIGMTAAEADQPEKTLPKAIKQFITRILVFYIGATAVIMVLSPWDTVDSQSGSPFVNVFNKIGIDSAGDILNFVVIAAAVSVLNSGSYSNGRMLLSLAEQKNAPRFFTKLNRGRVPYISILFSSFCTGLGLALNYTIPDGAFMRILAIVTTSVAISWAMIILVHLHFRHAHNKRHRLADRKEKSLIFQSPFYPFSNYCCLVFLGLLFILMLLTGFTKNGLLTHIFSLNIPLIGLPVPDVSISAVILPVWLMVIYGGFRLKKWKERSKTQ